MSDYLPNADTYYKLTHGEHIYEIPDTYIGSTKRDPRTELVYFEGQLVGREITVPEGLERLYIEILSNAADNVGRSRRCGVDEGEIVITMDRRGVRIRNGGIGIPIEVNQQTGELAPTLIFGELLTSSTFKGTRLGCGRNGYGAKLTNIFSHRFVVRCGNDGRLAANNGHATASPHLATPSALITSNGHGHAPLAHTTGKQYYGEWGSRMTRIREEVTPYNGPSFTEIEYYAELERFGYTEYDDECFALFVRHAIDVAFTTKARISFNGTDLSAYRDPSLYTRLIFGQEEHFVHSQPGLELVVVDSSRRADHPIAFANAMVTRDGGVHVEAVRKVLSKAVLSFINNKVNESLAIKPADVKHQLSLIINYWPENPVFGGQSKTKLSSPTPRVEIPSQQLELIRRWKVMALLEATLELKKMRELSKTDGSKRQYIKTEGKASDANKAGGPESANCVLWLCEGISASHYLKKWIAMIPKGKDYHGYLPLRGVPLNVLNADLDTIAANKEIAQLKKMLGLREGAVTSSMLRYGQVRIISDADPDGSHIRALITLIFACRWLALLLEGIIFFVRTPIVRAIKGKQMIPFYSTSDLERWMSTTPGASTWKFSYFKGLGSSDVPEIRQDFENPQLVRLVYDQHADYSLRLAFHSEYSEQRKGWLAAYRHVKMGVEVATGGAVLAQTITDCVNYDLIDYAIDSTMRCLPGMDGLKPGQRKIVYSSLRCGVLKKGGEIKVGQLAGLVASETGYKHDDECLSETIIRMSQDFTGTNNLPYFRGKGGFGTRDDGGDDACKPRYIKVKLSWWLRHVLRPEDDPILPMLIDEGVEAEPRTYLPVIPLHAANGAHGVAVGHSTSVPHYNPLEIILWLKQRLLGGPLPRLTPWYRGHTGDVVVTEEGFKSHGRFHLEPAPGGGCNVIVTELPIGVSLIKYKTMLEEWREAKVIHSFDDHSTDEVARYVIRGLEKPTLASLKLIRGHSTRNMVVYDENLQPHQFRRIDDLMEFFFEFRLRYYHVRRHHVVEKLRAELVERRAFEAFTRDVKSGAIIVFEQHRDYIYLQMDQRGHERHLYDKAKLSDFNLDQIMHHEAATTALAEKLEAYQQRTPESIWLGELGEFEGLYCQKYKCSPATLDQCCVTVVLGENEE
jgi:DNA topoisomerase-2